MTIKSNLFDAPVRIPAGALELAGFRRWTNSPSFPEQGRISFLDGEMEIDMNAEDISAHSDPKGSVTVALWILAEKHDIGRVFVDGVRLVNEVANISNEPDVIVCRWQTLESADVRLTESVPGGEKYTELVGTPDLVIEFVSDSSVNKDTRILRRKYFQAGIAEYWLFDARGSEIDFQLLTRGAKGFQPNAPDRQGFRLSSVFPLKFKLTRERDRIGHWRYTLQHRD